MDTHTHARVPVWPPPERLGLASYGAAATLLAAAQDALEDGQVVAPLLFQSCVSLSPSLLSLCNTEKDLQSLVIIDLKTKYNYSAASR